MGRWSEVKEKEEIIRLSGYEINQVQIKKKGTQLLFAILLLLGLYTAAEKYQDIQEKQDVTGYGQGETALMTEIPDVQNLPADIFAMENMLNPPGELSEIDFINRGNRKWIIRIGIKHNM